MAATLHQDPDFTGYALPYAQYTPTVYFWSLTPEQWYVVTRVIVREAMRYYNQQYYPYATVHTDSEALLVALRDDACKSFSHVAWGGRYPWPTLACLAQMYWNSDRNSLLYAIRRGDCGYLAPLRANPPCAQAVGDPAYSTGLAAAQTQLALYLASADPAYVNAYWQQHEEALENAVGQIWSGAGFSDTHGQPDPHSQWEPKSFAGGGSPTAPTLGAPVAGNDSSGGEAPAPSELGIAKSSGPGAGWLLAGAAAVAGAGYGLWRWLRH